MPAFQFQARDAQGTVQSGEVQANSQNAAVDQLRERGWLVQSLQEQRAETPPATNGKFPLPFTGPRSIHIELSLQQIAVMLRGGLTLLSALDTLSQQAQRAALRRLWREVTVAIEQGASFSEALENRRSIPDYVVRLVRVGEQTGVLETVLLRSAQMMQSRREAKRDLATAMVYPAIVVFAAVGVTVYMVAFLIPKVGNFLESIGKELPAMTQMLIDITHFFEAYGLAMLAALAVGTFAFIAFYSNPSGRLFVDRAVLRVPLIGRIFRLAGTTTFAQSLGTLISSGITVLEGLVTVEQLHRNQFLAQTVRNTRESVMQGQGLSDSLKVDGAYMPLLASMTAVGEQAGNLDDVLEEVGRFHEMQLKALIGQLAAWITPVVTIVIGGIVGFVYVAFFMALFAAGA